MKVEVSEEAVEQVLDLFHGQSAAWAKQFARGLYLTGDRKSGVASYAAVRGSVDGKMRCYRAGYVRGEGSVVITSVTRAKKPSNRIEWD